MRWSVASLILVAGCASHGAPAPKSEPPVEAASAPAAPAVPAGPFTLERAIARALEANPDAGIARQRLEQALAATAEVEAAFLPGLDARVAWTRTDDPLAGFGFLLRQRAYSPAIDPNHPGDQQDVRPDVVFAWNVFRGGADIEHRRAALEGEEAAKADVASAENALALAAAESFFALAKADEVVPVAEESLRAVETALDDARAREAAGKALAGDVLSLEARRSEARDTLVRARHGLEVARASLRAVLALPGDVPLEVLVTEAAPATPPLDEGAAIARALEHRADLRGMRARVTALEHEATATSREANPLLPRVDAFASYGVDSSNLRFSGNNDNWAVGVVADWNLFAGGRDRARARRTEAQLAETREAERKLELGIELEVRRARLALLESRERVSVVEDGERAAREAHRVVKEQFAAGAAPVTRFLEAEVALRDARFRAVSARADERVARAAMAKALGEAGRGEAR